MKKAGVYPRLCIDLDILRENTSQALEMCAKCGIMVTAVTKSFCGDLRTAAALLDGGVTHLGDAQVINLKKLTGFPCEKWLVRAPCAPKWRRPPAVCGVGRTAYPGGVRRGQAGFLLGNRRAPGPRNPHDRQQFGLYGFGPDGQRGNVPGRGYCLLSPGIFFPAAGGNLSLCFQMLSKGPRLFWKMGARHFSHPLACT